ncbi:MAG: TatD family hydrolase [Comamonadaceae bacterium]|nr:TatD family hydrolase [Comamonadaceae bacterium]
MALAVVNQLRQCPGTAFCLETDGPFTQDRGTPLMPWQAWDVCDGLAEAWGPRRRKTPRLQMHQNLKVLLPPLA